MTPAIDHHALRLSALNAEKKNPAGAARPAPGTAAGKKLKQACTEFESILVSQLLAAMRATVPKNPLFGGGQAETLFSSMRDEEMAREISAQGGFGLSRLLFERLGRGAAACAFQPEDSGAPAVDADPTDQYGTKGPSDGD